MLEQAEAVGYCVRAMYLYIPLTDTAALTGQPEYVKADDTLWQDVVFKKMYITGEHSLQRRSRRPPGGVENQ